MSDVASAAAALGLPEALVQRSAEARATETGSSVDEILAAWAGGKSAPAASESPDQPEPSEPAEQTGEPGATENEPTADEVPEVSIEIPARRDEQASPARSATATRAPAPAEVTMAEAANLPVVVTVPTTGIKERMNFAVPRWLAGLFLVVPVFAVFALGSSATGECGSATELVADVITGEIVNCDGSKFEGSSIGGGGSDFIALGEGLYQGQEIGSVNCAGCHGAQGGGGVGPALNGVLTVFGACSDHIEWVTLGTQGFQAAGRSTYGDSNKTVGGVGTMPPFSSLTDEQIAAVSAFERVRFGGEAPEEALTDCGLAEEPTEGGEGAEGETPETNNGTGGDGSVGTEDTTPDGDA